jgi:GAF domain-containing protein
VFAEQAASAIVNARLYEGERDRVAELLVLRGGEEAAS